MGEILPTGCTMNLNSVYLLTKRLGRVLAYASVLSLAGLFLAACDIGSVDSTTAVLADNTGTIYNFSGLYARVDTNSVQQPLVFPTGKQSGRAVTWVRLLQYGSSLEAYDNAGMSWDGSISSVQNGTATFNLRGRTTAGAAVDVAGALRYADQNSTMDATWIEPGFSGSILARATVSPAATNTPSSKVKLTASSSTISSNATVTLTASGGSSYAWRLSTTAYGTLAHYSSYSTNSYTRTAGSAGNTITITATSGDSSADATLSFN